MPSFPTPCHAGCWRALSVSPRPAYAETEAPSYTSHRLLYRSRRPHRRDVLGRSTWPSFRAARICAPRSARASSMTRQRQAEPTIRAASSPMPMPTRWAGPRTSKCSTAPPELDFPGWSICWRTTRRFLRFTAEFIPSWRAARLGLFVFIHPALDTISRQYHLDENARRGGKRILSSSVDRSPRHLRHLQGRAPSQRGAAVPDLVSLQGRAGPDRHLVGALRRAAAAASRSCPTSSSTPSAFLTDEKQSRGAARPLRQAGRADHQQRRRAIAPPDLRGFAGGIGTMTTAHNGRRPRAVASPAIYLRGCSGERRGGVATSSRTSAPVGPDRFGRYRFHATIRAGLLLPERRQDAGSSGLGLPAAAFAV